MAPAHVHADAYRRACEASRAGRTFSDVVREAADAGYAAGLLHRVIADPADLVIVPVGTDWSPEHIAGFAAEVAAVPAEARPQFVLVAAADVREVPNGQIAYRAGRDAARAELAGELATLLERYDR